MYAQSPNLDRDKTGRQRYPAPSQPFAPDTHRPADRGVTNRDHRSSDVTNLRILCHREGTEHCDDDDSEDGDGPRGGADKPPAKHGQSLEAPQEGTPPTLTHTTAGGWAANPVPVTVT